MKSFLFALCIAAAFNCFGQNANTFAVCFQPGLNVSRSPSVENAFLIGIRNSDGGDFMVGIFGRKLMNDPGHGRNYVGARVYGSRRVAGKFGAYIQAEFRRGTYYLYDAAGGAPKAGKAMRLFGNFGIDYRVTDHVALMGSYVIQDYNPVKYLETGLSPHKSGAVKFGLNFILPVSQ